jgi:ribosome-binding factor A
MSLRRERLKKEFFKNIKEFFLYQVNNPILKDISIQEIVISKDLSYLKVFYQTPKDIDDKLTVALIKVAPVIKSTLAKNLNLRKIPNILFVYDNRSEYVRKVDSILGGITYSEQSEEDLIGNYKNLDLEDL